MTAEPSPAALRGAITRLVLAQVAALSLWFSAAAVLPALAAQRGLEVGELAALATATQAGFVFGALLLAVTGAADRFDPRRLFAAAAVLAAGANLGLLVFAPDGTVAWLSRALVGAALAGVYPVGLKIAVGWSRARRGLVVSLLVGALTLGSSSPHLVALLGGADATSTLVTTSLLATTAAALVWGCGLGPFHARNPRFDPTAVSLAVRHAGIRSAYLGYFGHMWELYAFWAWVGVAAAAAATRAGLEDPGAYGSAIAFSAIALGGVGCVPAGWIADRVGKGRVARGAMLLSGASALVAAAAFDRSLAVLTVAFLVWGLTVVPDSPQFSALVADRAPADKAGSLMTLQTALGFALTTITVQLAPRVAERFGWPAVFVVLAAGPVFGVLGLGRVRPQGAASAPTSAAVSGRS